jgi:NADPH-dependent glutamate synthase beta subunit-like oxidoreductase
MDQKLLRQREAKCVQENPPGCTARCPVHVDARGLVNSVRKEDYAAGFALLYKMIPFPGIISRICDQPCQRGCKRSEIDEPIFMRALESVCVDNNSTIAKFVVPAAKSQRVAIVGAGLSGLTVAFELGRKGYKVVIFEATDRFGGSIWNNSENQLPRQVIYKDFSILEKMPFEVHYNTTITSLDSLYENFDAIYLGTGFSQDNASNFELALADDGEIKIDLLTLATSHNKVFAGGSLRCKAGNPSPITSISDGKIAAGSIDRLFQNASLTANRANEGPFETELYTNIKGIKPEAMAIPANPSNGYTKAEANQEANRCLLCECLECVKVCEYLAHYHAYPKRYVREVYNNLSIVMGIHRANKLINSCSLCGLCEQVCPGKLNMGEICHQARQMMVETGKMPPSVHDFALRDMQFSTSDNFTLTRHQPGYTSSELVFYPGCQLAASSPDHVKQMYSFLCEKLPGGVGLMLGCCGAPANWAGQTAVFQSTMKHMEERWHSLGSPKVITACPTCYSLLKHNSPDMPVESLWTLLTCIGLPEGNRLVETPQRLAIHDSCTTRYEAEIQSSVRDLLVKLGYQFEELPLSRENTVCCGYGGLMLYANKEITHKVINRRIKESELDYLAYCAMCRDNFSSQGKRVYHLLDLIFGNEENELAGREGPGYSERQENRARLKTSLLREVWGERVNEVPAAVKVVIPDNVLRIMEDRMILVDDVTHVIAHAESTGCKMQDAGSGYYIAYFQPASVTYWVEYQPQGEGFVVRNAYCHRLNITG